MSLSRLDLVVFGASGFTGKYVAKEIAKVAEKNKQLTWGVAGRNKERLQEALSSVGIKQEVPILIADVKNEESLNQMTALSKVILNCCGPFRFLGEAVVKACIKNGAHHVDVSGEPQYMEMMQLKYHDAAAEAGIYIVSACGFDSIPTDLGVLYLGEKFPGQLNSVETYLESEIVGEAANVKCAKIHYTTWESAVHGIAAATELPELRRKLYPTRLPPLTPRLPARSALHKSDVINKWCLPFPGSDRSVVHRTQRYLFENEKKRPVHIFTYVAFPSLFYALLTAFLGMVFGIMANTSLGRNILLRYPRFFSLGMVSHEGPTPEVAEATEFSVTLVGRGWSESSAEPLDKHVNSPDRQLVVRVGGKNPGYGATAAALVVSALTILNEADKMPGKGGVLAPGAAFAGTTFVKQLPKLLDVEILGSKDLKEASCHSYLGNLIHEMFNGGIY